MPVPLGWEWKTGVARGFRSIGKNCACAGGKNVARDNVLFGA